MKEYETNNNKRFDNEKNTIIMTYEQNITVINRQFEEYKI